jgi:membrane protein implicated in regulation of membrane protease activity
MEKLSAIALVTGLVLIGISIYFFLLSVSLMMPGVYAIASGLAAIIIGFISLGAGVSLIKSYLIVRAAEKVGETKEKEEK